tara:strand:- start:264 stop:464 length:201 start_codon:yes stop_codon:yes gene_type:complete
MSKMEALEREIKNLMNEMMNKMIMRNISDEDLLSFLPCSDNPYLQVRLPPGAPNRNTPKTGREKIK